MRNSKPIRILVVDDHFMVRMGLSASLNVEPDMEVVAEAGNGKAALEAYHKHRPNLVMMDLRLPGMSRHRVHGSILHELPDACILMLSTHSGEEEIYRAMQAGARGYIVKSIIREELLRAIREVHRGQRYLDPVVASLLAERLSHRSLTTRELEVSDGGKGIRKQRDRERPRYRGGDGKVARQSRAREAQREGSHRRRPLPCNEVSSLSTDLPSIACQSQTSAVRK